MLHFGLITSPIDAVKASLRNDDVTPGETELEMAVRHVAEQEARITRQELLIEHLREVGAPFADALRFLDSMREFLEAMRAHVARLSN